MSICKDIRTAAGFTLLLSMALPVGQLEARSDKKDGITSSHVATVANSVESTPYAGTLRVTKQTGLVDSVLIDLTPPEGRNLLPIRFILNKLDDETFFLTATRENGLFNLGAQAPAKLDAGKLKFSISGFEFLGNLLSVQIELQLVDNETLSGKFSGRNENDGTSGEGEIAMSVADPSQTDWYNGIFAGNITIQAESGDSSRVESLKEEMMLFFSFTDRAFVQVGNLAAHTFFPKNAGNSHLAKTRQVSPHPLFSASGFSGNGTYILFGYFVGVPAQNTLSLLIDDQVLTQIGVPDDPLYNEVEKYDFTREGNALTALVYWKEEDLSGAPEVGEVTSQYVGAVVEETFNILRVEIVPSAGAEIKTGQSATIEIKVVDQLNKVKEDFNGGATIRLLENLTTPGITRLPASQSVSLSRGVAQPVFFFTPKEPFAPDKPIQFNTVLSGKAVIEVQLENSTVPAVTREISVKSPLDFFVDRIEIQQGVIDTDKDVILEYQPGVSRTFPALPFIVEHNTAVRVFVGYKNTVPIAFSKIEQITDITAKLKVSWKDQVIMTIDEMRSGGHATRLFELQDSYSLDEQVMLQDALFAFFDHTKFKDSGMYTFDVELRFREKPFGATLDEIASEKGNNKKSAVTSFAETYFFTIHAGVGVLEGSPFPEVPEDIWNFLRNVYPIQHSKLIVDDPNLEPFYFTKGFFSLLARTNFLIHMSLWLNRWNKDNPAKQREKILIFADLSIVKNVCGPASGCVHPLVPHVAITTLDKKTLTHELGHTLGLKDTYSGLFIFNGEPNPRRSDATDAGNFVGDGNIDLIKRVKALKASTPPYLDFMGGSSTQDFNYWIDRVTWDYLYRSKFGIGSQIAPATTQGVSASGFIAISGFIDTTEAATLNTFLTLPQVPFVSEPQAGAYSLEFVNSSGTLLSAFQFDVEFFIYEVGEVSEAPFSFYLPLPEGTFKVAMKKNGVEIASRTFSANPPVTQLISPTSGETIRGVKTIQWTASDPDGDRLTYDILYSADGQKQSVLAVNVEETSFAWDSRLWPSSSSASITVIANDGINEGRAVADHLVIDNPTGVDNQDETLPSEYALKQNHPNPFNPETQIQFELSKPSQVKIEIYNIHGQKIRSLVDEKKAAGSHIVTWDGRTDNGELAASGVYFYRLVAGDFRQTRKMALLR